MATLSKSVESSSAYSINQDSQDGLDVFTDLEQLEQAKAAYNQAKQVGQFQKINVSFC
jgi:hypothetical protein